MDDNHLLTLYFERFTDDTRPIPWETSLLSRFPSSLLCRGAEPQRPAFYRGIGPNIRCLLDALYL